MPVLKVSTLVLKDSSCGYDPIIYHYGLAQSQLERINVPPLHAMGLDATGVRLGFLDTGFRWRVVAALLNRHILSEYDYVFHDSVTANQTGDDPGQDGHGTATFCTAMGYLPDTMIGPAYNASVYLAKTEDIRSEHHIEEDNYAAALEDMEAAGVDITTSSVGYFGFDPPDTSYTFADLNGHTTIAARAVQHATRLGVLVVTAMGNSGKDLVNPHEITPADADSIISVGALAPDNTIADFSSRGPTGDGRMKPEICSPGIGVWTEDVNGVMSADNGTSFATPLTSSACCLIKQAHPEATAQQIRRAIMKTGDNAAHPDTAFGWGRLNAYAAALELGAIIHRKSTSADSLAHFCFGIAAKGGVKISFITYHTSTDPTPRNLPLSLAADSLIYSASTPIVAGTKLYYTVTVVSGANIAATCPKTGYDSITAPPPQLVVSAYPNPASDFFQMKSSAPVDWSIYDQAGRRELSGSLMHAAETSLVDERSSTVDERSSTIDTHTLPNGVYYLLLVSAEQGSRTLPIVILR